MKSGAVRRKATAVATSGSGTETKTGKKAEKPSPLRGTWRHMIHDIRCGIHSGIPACCIAFYIGHWMHGFEGMKEAQYITRHRKRMREAKLSGYIACPDCLTTKNLVRPNICACGHLTDRARREGGVE